MRSTNALLATAWWYYHPYPQPDRVSGDGGLGVIPHTRHTPILFCLLSAHSVCTQAVLAVEPTR